MGDLRERWRTGVVAVALGLMAVGWFLPWSSNAIVGDGSSSDVLFADGAVGVATRAILIALPLLLVAGLWRVRWSAALGVVAAVVLFLALVAQRAHLSDQQANVIGETATGEMFEDWATTTAGLGLVLWLVASGLLLVVTGAGLIATLRPPAPRVADAA